jgi:hypothetical protein
MSNKADSQDITVLFFKLALNTKTPQNIFHINVQILVTKYYLYLNSMKYKN